MKRYAALALLLAACQPDKPAATTTVPTPTPPGEAARPAAELPADTLHVAD